MGSNPIPRINYPTLVRHLTRIHIYYYHLLTRGQGAPVKTTATNPVTQAAATAVSPSNPGTSTCSAGIHPDPRKRRLSAVIVVATVNCAPQSPHPSLPSTSSVRSGTAFALRSLSLILLGDSCAPVGAHSRGYHIPVKDARNKYRPSVHEKI